MKMRGGTLRFQAQYLRRIRLPSPDILTAADQAALSPAFDQRDSVAATEIAIRLSTDLNSTPESFVALELPDYEPAFAAAIEQFWEDRAGQMAR